MDWRASGILLSVRSHGETSAILDVFTAAHGRHAGVLRGGMSKRYRPVLQPGSELLVEWRARLHEHIGSFRIELERSRAARLFSDRLALAALVSACAVLSRTLPEREPNPDCYARTRRLFDALESAGGWFAEYLSWELELLAETGFGLDLTECAVTGATRDLVYVSPKTGRAVSRRGAGEWAGRLLPLPPCLLGGELSGMAEMSDGLHTIGHFLKLGIAERGRPSELPMARIRFAESVRRLAG